VRARCKSGVKRVTCAGLESSTGLFNNAGFSRPRSQGERGSSSRDGEVQVKMGPGQGTSDVLPGDKYLHASPPRELAHSREHLEALCEDPIQQVVQSQHRVTFNL